MECISEVGTRAINSPYTEKDGRQADESAHCDMPVATSRKIRFKQVVDWITFAPARRSPMNGREWYPSAKDDSPFRYVDPCTDVDRYRIWRKTCKAIRDAGNLAVEIEAPYVSTNSTLCPVSLFPHSEWPDQTYNGKDRKPCMKAITSGDQQRYSDNPLREPVLWSRDDLTTPIAQKYQIDPWIVLEAERTGSKRTVAQVRTPFEYHNGPELES